MFILPENAFKSHQNVNKKILHRASTGRCLSRFEQGRGHWTMGEPKGNCYFNLDKSNNRVIILKIVTPIGGLLCRH